MYDKQVQPIFTLPNEHRNRIRTIIEDFAARLLAKLSVAIGAHGKMGWKIAPPTHEKPSPREGEPGAPGLASETWEPCPNPDSI